MIEIHKIGMWYGHFYEENGRRRFVECTKNEYEALGKKDAGAPKVNGRWLHSGCFSKFDTDSGFQENDTFYDYYGDGKKIVVKNINGKIAYITRSDIVGGTIADNLQPKWL